jgi:hypothetical protein
MRKIFCGLIVALAFASTRSHAANPEVPTYAFLSLIGDKLEIVVAQLQTGSLLDKNRREPAVEIKDPVFDNAVATAAGQAVRAVFPAAELAILNTRSPILFEKHRDLFEEKGGVIAIPDAIRGALANEKATHLVLITKHRDNAYFEFTNANEGSGMLEGLGFYLDGAMETKRSDTSESGRGYIAPYVYAKVTLVDVKTSKVIAKQTIKATMTISSARAQQNLATPWAALSSAEKVNAINRLIQREMARVVPLLLKVD